MGIEVRPAEDDEIEKWNTYVNRSEQGTIFHRYEWLKTVERHSSASLHTYIGMKGETVIGLFPFYKMKKGPFKVIFSPLPGMGIPFLGPMLILDPKMKQKTTEKTNKNFIEGWLETVESIISPSYYKIIMVPEYNDARPFSWGDFSLSISYTYRIDLNREEDDIINNFSKSARSPIRDANENDYDIREGDEDTIDFIWSQINRRYKEQSRSYPLKKEYLKDVYHSLPEDKISIYEGFVNGKRVSGCLSVHSSKVYYRWVGSPKPKDRLDVEINDLLHWRTIRDGIAKGIPWYDLIGANTYRICRYKSKFNPELIQYHNVERGTMPARLAVELYKKIKVF